MSTELLNQTQDYNPLTGDIQLNPAAWGLSLQDINSAATISLKSSIYAGNVNLTADQYREIQSLVKTKYSGVDYTGMIKGGGMTSDISMTGRDPGLYMNQERIGFWKDDIDQWQAYIGNNGNFAFKGDANNYIAWNGSELVIRGSIYLEDGTSITEMNNTFYQDTTPITFTDGDIWFDTNDGNKMYLARLGAWVSVQDTLISEAINLANDAQTTADGKIDCFYQATAPAVASEGDIWFDTDDGNKIYTRRSGVWVVTQDSLIAQAITNAQTAQTTADGKARVYYQTSAPVLTVSDVGDLWVDTDAGNRIATWNGTAWVNVSNADAITALANAATAQATADGKIDCFYQATAPGTASEGDIWFDTDDGNKIYTRRSGVWVVTQDSLIGTAINNAQTAQTTADGKAKVYYQTTAPVLTASDVGDLWVDTDDNNKITTWNGAAWVSTSNADALNALAAAATAQATADGKIDCFYQASAPGTASEGDIWFDTDDGNKIYTRRSGVWVVTQDSLIATAINNAQTAQTTADGKAGVYYQASPPVLTAGDVGDLWVDTDAGNRIATWNGTAWVAVSNADAIAALAAAATAQSTADGKIDSFYQTTAPVTASEGDIWFDTDDGNKIYTRRSGVWVATQDSLIAQAINNAQTAQSTADGKAKVYYQASEPVLTAGDVGDLWVETDNNNKVYTWSGTAWFSTTNQGAIDALAAAATAQATADGKIESFYQTTAPVVFSEGDIWFDTDDGNKIYTARSGVWVATQDSLIAQAITNAQTAQTTADGKARVYYQTSAPVLTASDVGDLWVDTDSGNRVATWNGTAWVSVSNADAIDALAAAATAQSTADGKIDSFYQTTAPVTASEGDIWFDTDDGNKIYTYRTGAWVATQDSLIGQAINNAQTAQTTADGKAKVYYQISAPALVAGDIGDLWVDTDAGNKVMTWNGSGWVDITNTDALTALANAATAQATADGKIDCFYQASAPVTAGEGDIWFDTDDGNKIYTRRSGAWVVTQDSLIATAINNAQTAQTTADGKAKVYYQISAPILTASDVGDLWVDTDDSNKVSTWNGTAWVSTTNADALLALANAATAQSTADGKITTFYVATAPTVGVSEGDIWFDTDDGNKMYTRRSGVWVNTQDTKIGDAITAAAGAQATADGKVTTFYLPTASAPTAEAIGDLWYDTTSTILKRWSGSAWQDARDVGATRAAAALDSSSRYTKWLESNSITETKTKTGYTGVVLDNDGIGGYTAGVATFRVDRITGSAFYSGSITAAGLDVGSAGNIRGGQTAYNTGTGFFLGYSGAAHKFSIGNVTNSLTWDGTDLLITGALTSTATITGGSFRTYNATTLRYSEITPGKISLQNSSNIDIVSIDGSNFRYINADAVLSANTHHAFQTTAGSIAGFGSTIGFDFGTYNDSTKAFSSYGTQLLFNYNSPTSVDSLTVNEIKNFTAPNYSTTAPILYFKGYANIAYLINASFVGRMKIPVGTNLY